MIFYLGRSKQESGFARMKKQEDEKKNIPVISRTVCGICGSRRLVFDETLDARKLGHCRDCGFREAIEFDPNAIQNVYLNAYYSSEDDPRIDAWARNNRKVWEYLCKDLPRKNYADIMDFGAGTGGFLSVFHSLHPEAGLFAVESSPQARKHLEIQFPGISVFSELDGFENRFDLVCALQVLEHVDDLQRICKQIYSSMKPGGIFLLTVPNRHSYEALIYEKNRSHVYGNQTHLQFFSRRDVQRLLRQTGFLGIKRLASLEFGKDRKFARSLIQFLLRRLALSTELRFIACKPDMKK